MSCSVLLCLSRPTPKNPESHDFHSFRFPLETNSVIVKDQSQLFNIKPFLNNKKIKKHAKQE